MLTVIALGVVLAFLLALLGLMLIALVGLLYFIPRGAPYVATANSALVVLLSLARLKKGEKVIDVGSGDGKVVIALAKRGVEAHGVEFNPLLVYWSRWRIRKLDIHQHATIHLDDMWRHDLSSYDVIIIYGISYIMGRMEKKLIREAKIGARIVTNDFSLPNWKPVKKQGRLALYVKH